MDRQRVIVDTDTAGDDTQALVLAALSDRVDLEALTVVAGNVDFEYEVENAKYALDRCDAADVPVYEGVREPLQKEYDTAEYVHGEGGLGGDLFPDTGIDSAEGHAVDHIVEAARENPGELTLVAIGPLTNVAMACVREPDLDDLLDEVWVMGGAVNTVGNVTPAAEYNFWVDPDAADIVTDHLDVTLVDWGLTVRDSTFEVDTLERIADAADGSRYAAFYDEITTSVREFNEEAMGRDCTTQPDSLAMACVLAPDIVEQTGRYHLDVDEREGPTRGYSLVDEGDVLEDPANATVVESVDADAFRELFLDAVVHGEPHRRH
jgi:purine nucleosidase